MTDLAIATPQLAKFADPDRTAKGEVRARVKLDALRTLWINTGTLCNIECRNCYIELEPRERPACLYHSRRGRGLSRRDRA